MNKREKKITLLLSDKRLIRFLKNRNKQTNDKYSNKKLKRNINLINFLNEVGFKKRCTVHQNRKNTIIIPKNFSLLSNPDESVEVLMRLFFLCTNKKVKHIYIDYKSVENLDICASTVMDSIIMECEKYRGKIGEPLDFSGEYKGNRKVKDILEVSGILKHLGFEVKEPEYIEKLELIECGESDKVATNVTDYFDKCLSTQKYELNRKGKLYFSQMVGELLDNCKIHGGYPDKWYTIGHYFNEENHGECQIAIFNYGKSIYESLCSEKTSVETIESLNEITKVHEKRFNNIFWSKEALWTLFALQDGVSSFRDSKSDPDRGTGTVKFIDSFQQIGCTEKGESPLMSVTSGKVSILFNDKYRLKDTDVNGEIRKVIAFNQENDLFKCPDRKNVRILKNGFPGTLIVMKFYLDKDYIEGMMEGNKNEKSKSK